jgi:hypothetical protein
VRLGKPDLQFPGGGWPGSRAGSGGVEGARREEISCRQVAFFLGRNLAMQHVLVCAELLRNVSAEKCLETFRKTLSNARGAQSGSAQEALIRDATQKFRAVPEGVVGNPWTADESEGNRIYSRSGQRHRLPGTTGIGPADKAAFL